MKKVTIACSLEEVKYKLSSLDRVKTLFSSSNILNFNKYGDFCVLSPMMALKKPVENIKAGQLVIPIKDTEHSMSVFVPGDCDDEGNNSFTKIYSIIDGLNSSMLPEKYMEGRPITTKKGQDTISLPAGHNLEEGDYLIVFGKPYEVCN